MHDVLIHSGVRFRRDSISVLCEPTFRDTLLREVLTSTTTIDGGRPLAVQGADLEALVSARSDALDDAGTSDDVGGTRSHALARAHNYPSRDPLQICTYSKRHVHTRNMI